MSLQFVVDSIESLPEPIQTLYEKDGEKFRLKLDGYEDPVALKSALQKERDAARAASKQASAWANLGKSPDEIHALLEAQRKAEEEKAIKGGEWEKLRKQMEDQNQAVISKLEERLKAKDSAIERHLIDAQATAAISEAKGVPALLLPHIKAAVKVVIDDGGAYETRVVDAGGNPRVDAKGNYLTIKDLVSEMRQSDVFGRAFESFGATGGGASGSAGTGGASGHPGMFDPKKLVGNKSERIASIAARFPELNKG